jgi:hypothetical protein
MRSWQETQIHAVTRNECSCRCHSPAVVCREVCPHELAALAGYLGRQLPLGAVHHQVLVAAANVLPSAALPAETKGWRNNLHQR